MKWLKAAVLNPPLTIKQRSRLGSITTTLLLGLGGMMAVGAAIHGVPASLTTHVTSFFKKKEHINYLVTNVQRGPFVYNILERGEIESSSNVEVRCEVSGRTSSGVNIIEIIPEGTWVEAGDFLVKLDDAALQTQLIQQQIVSSNSESTFIEAQATLDSAKLALDEYAEGTFIEQLEKLESELFVAEENMRRSEEYLEYSKRLAERGYVPEAQLEADIFAVEKARKELGVAETKLHVLKSFTKERFLTQLRADIQTAEARLQARKKTRELDLVQLNEIKTQIERCRIVAPVAGQVVYANNRDGRSGSSTGTVLIEEGMPVRERQTIVRLPDPKRMRVMAKVHESRVGNVKTGMIANLMLDAMPELALSGRVTSVSEYPLPPINVYMAHVKEFAVEVEIENPPRDLRPGMTAEVNIVVSELDDAVQVPIETLTQRDGKYFCAIPSSDGPLQAREVNVGLVNETVAVILSGLTENEKVVLNMGSPEVQGALSLPETSSKEQPDV